MYFPSATYRVQLNSSYPFSQLKAIISYLHKLGISTIYAAPITTSMSGSTHGYDVCNPDELNPEIGTMEEFEKISQQLKEKGMSWLQDVVPNHMAFIIDNERLMDVFERGEQSPYYNYFDINWNHFDATYKGKLMVPFIGKDLNEAIRDNEIKLVFDEDFYLSYFDTKYPVAVNSLAVIISLLNNELLQNETANLLGKTKSSKDEWKGAKKEWLTKIKGETKSIAEAVNNINENKALLREFIQQQHYLLTWFKVTESEINFRRFFTVNQLICLRMEDESVYTDYHRFIFSLYQKGLIQGVRIDHIDGLYHPQEYVDRLRKSLGEDCYIVAEKILEYNEDIARDWKLQGTSGYEFLSFTNQLLTDKKGAEKLLAFYKELVPQSQSYEDIVFQKKHAFLYSQMQGELDNLVHLAKELKVFPIAAFSQEGLKKALGILMASFPVYRIYPDAYPLHKEALPIVKKAFEKASQKGEDVQQELQLLQTLFDANGKAPGDQNKLLFLMRLMQFTGPLAAKGVEDTTFYVYNPLISHNEVGDSPLQLGITIDEFHQKMKSRQENNPYSLNATSTHDTKRGEDGRMRINALAAMPDKWIQNVNNWRQMNTPFVKMVKNKPAPSTNDEYFIYQSLIGAFPEDLTVTEAFISRTLSFIEKALREAKVETTYSEPNVEYEEACKSFITSLLDEKQPFLKSFTAFLDEVIDAATLYSLAQTVIKITAPGIPDVYQGCELWDISYVDPDNRRPIDYDCRISNLDEIIALERGSIESLLSFLHQHKKEGREKLYAIYKTLNLRTAHNDLFLHGKYIPLQTNEEKVMAYARRRDENWVIVVIPFCEELLQNKEAITVMLPTDAPKHLTNIFTNETIDLTNNDNLISSLQKFPVAVLTAGW